LTRGGTSFNYDLRGNLRASSGVVYLIYGEGRRVGKKTGSNLSQGLVYGQAPRPVAELAADGSIASTFWFGTRQYTPDYMVKGGITYRIVSDYLGSPRVVINMQNGLLAEQLDYDEWGNVTDSVPGFQPFGFTGGIYDAGSALVRLGARDYEPGTGRWTSKDPIRFGGGDANIYAYVGNDSIDSTDPEGTGPLDLLRCLLGPTPASVCFAEELDRLRHGPAGDNRNGDGWGGGGGGGGGGGAGGAGGGMCPDPDYKSRKKAGCSCKCFSEGRVGLPPSLPPDQRIGGQTRYPNPAACIGAGYTGSECK